MRRVLFALVPLVTLLLLVEVVAFFVARSSAAQRTPDPLLHERVLHPDRMDAPTAAGPTIVCVGDSWTYGFGVPEAESYPFQLQVELRERGLSDTLVVNLGNPGASPVRAARALARYLQDYDADLVVWLAGANTPSVRAAFEDERPPQAMRWTRRMLRKLTTYKLLAQASARARLEADAYLRDPTVSQPEAAKPGERAPPTIPLEELSVDTVFKNMVRLADLSDAYDVEALVLTYAMPLELLDDPRAPGAQYRRVNRASLGAARESGLLVLDLERLFLDAGLPAEEALLYGSERISHELLDLHPAGPGYALMAEAVAKEIEPLVR